MKCFLDGKSFIIIRPNIPNTQGRDFWGRGGEVCTGSRSIQGIHSEAKFIFSPGIPGSLGGGHLPSIFH